MPMPKPWLLLPPQWAHDVSPHVLPIISRLSGHSHMRYRPFTWKGQTFEHPVGIAGGVDKSGRNFLDWERLGASFVEIGTVTPQPQEPNPPPLIMRDVESKALWNKLGFPSEGAERIKQRIAKKFHKSTTPLWVNVGKNRTTPNEKALEDYLYLFETFSTLASSFVVNMSSPNTKALRDLQSEEFLTKLLEHYHAMEDLNGTPILIKLSPDLDIETLEKLLRVGEDLGVHGWILTNTTKSRDFQNRFPKDEGGVSGAPLAKLSMDMLSAAVRILGTRAAGRKTLIVSTGGIMSARDVQMRLDLGADLVQVYSALVFEGPWFFRKVVRQLNSSPASL
jgi:dihydroorotate dehydrogenase